MSSHYLENVWCIRDPAPLSKYYILYWSASHFLSTSQDGLLVREGISFQVRYHRTTRGKILSSLDNAVPSQVALSFRSNGSNHYVLVSLLNQESHKVISV